MATTFLRAVTSAVFKQHVTTCGLILGVSFRGQPIWWRHSRFSGSKGHCHAFYIWGAHWRHL